jgi:hypothetical protein
MRDVHCLGDGFGKATEYIPLVVAHDVSLAISQLVPETSQFESLPIIGFPDDDWRVAAAATRPLADAQLICVRT